MVKIEKIIFSIFLLIIFSYSVKAFGVSSPHWDENPLYLQSGETKDVTMYLQNMVGSEDITVIGNLNGGYDIAEITDQSTTYNVPLGSNNVPVNLRINVPENAKPGDEWQVGVSFKTVASNTGGVALGTGVSKGFKVIVKEQPSGRVTKLTISSQFLGFLILVVILIVLFALIKYFHKKRVQ